MTQSAINTTFPIGPDQGGTGTSILPSNGRILLGDTGNLLPKPVTAGTGITVTAGAGSLAFALRNAVLVYSTVANNDAALAYPAGVAQTGYRGWILVWSNVKPATDGASMLLQQSNNNQTSWATTGYSSGLNVSDWDAATWTNSNNATGLLLSPALNSATSSQTANGFVQLHVAPANRIYISGTVTVYDKNRAKVTYGYVGGSSGANSMTDIRFIMTAGNIASGTFRLYGMQL